MYERLDECVKKMLHFVGRYNVVTHVDTCLLQIFLWERFSGLQNHRVFNYRDGGGQGWGSEETEERAPYIPKAWRSAGVKQAGNKSLVKVNDEEEHFKFHLYYTSGDCSSPPI